MKRHEGFAWLLVVSVLSLVVVGCQGEPTGGTAPGLQEAERLRMSNDPAQALGAAQRFINENPNTPYKSDALLLMGECEMTLGQYPQAQRHFQDAQMKPRNNAIAARARFGMGDAAFAQDSYTDAISAYQSALKTGKGDIPAAKATYKLGLAQIRNQNWAEGRTYMRQVRDGYGSSEQAEWAKDVLVLSTDGFQLQCGAFADPKSTDALMAKLHSMGLQPRVQTITRGGRPLQAVRVGSYGSYVQARQECDRLRSQKIEAFVFP